jgi:hypothetical protein
MHDTSGKDIFHELEKVLELPHNKRVCAVCSVKWFCNDWFQEKNEKLCSRIHNLCCIIHKEVLYNKILKYFEKEVNFHICVPEDRLCGLVVRGSGFDSRHFQIF